jgi:hypothetical protein
VCCSECVRETSRSGVAGVALHGLLALGIAQGFMPLLENRLREKDPVHFVGPLGFCFVTRHNDVKLLFNDPERVTQNSKACHLPAALARRRELDGPRFPCSDIRSGQSPIQIEGRVERPACRSFAHVG